MNNSSYKKKKTKKLILFSRQRVEIVNSDVYMHFPTRFHFQNSTIKFKVNRYEPYSVSSLHARGGVLLT